MNRQGREGEILVPKTAVTSVYDPLGIKISRDGLENSYVIGEQSGLRRMNRY